MQFLDHENRGVPIPGYLYQEPLRKTGGGGTFREHSGNIQSESGIIQGTFSQNQGSFRDHSGNIQGTFREHSGNIQGTFREHSGNIQADSGNIQ